MLVVTGVMHEADNALREDSQIDFGTPNVNLTYGGRGFQTMLFRKRSKIP